MIFTEATVERTNLELARPTDIVVSILLSRISIQESSILEIRIPREHLDLNGSGNGRCKLLSNGNSPWASCSADTLEDAYVVLTEPMIVGERDSSLQLRLSDIFANP